MLSFGRLSNASCPPQVWALTSQQCSLAAGWSPTRNDPWMWSHCSCLCPRSLLVLYLTKWQRCSKCGWQIAIFILGVLGASLVYSLSKPCGSLVGFRNVAHLQVCRIGCLSLKNTLILTYSSGWLFCWGVCPHHSPLGHHRPQLARRLPRFEVAIISELAMKLSFSRYRCSIIYGI